MQAATEAEVNWTCFVSRLNCWVPEPRKLPTLYPGLREKSTPIVSHKHFVIKKYEAEKTGCGGEIRGLHRGVLLLRGGVCMCGPLSSFQNGTGRDVILQANTSGLIRVGQTKGRTRRSREQKSGVG